MKIIFHNLFQCILFIFATEDIPLHLSYYASEGGELGDLIL